ncbi:MAG: hypothetical protein ACKPER_26235 [Dolichospermum sp.]
MPARLIQIKYTTAYGYPGLCRSAFRNDSFLDDLTFGFRVVCSGSAKT